MGLCLAQCPALVLGIHLDHILTIAFTECTQLYVLCLKCKEKDFKVEYDQMWYPLRNQRAVNYEKEMI